MGQRRANEPGRLSPRERLEAKIQRYLVAHKTWFTSHEIQDSDEKRSFFFFPGKVAGVRTAAIDEEP